MVFCFILQGSVVDGLTFVYLHSVCYVAVSKTKGL